MKLEWSKAENRYYYLSREQSALYDRAKRGEISPEEANQIIASLLEQVAGYSRGAHCSSAY